MADDEIDDLPDDEDEPEEGSAAAKKPVDRKADLSKRAGVNEQLLELFADVTTGFTDQWERSNDQMDYWDVYNCELTSRQFYSGNSKIFVPIVHNAINARKTRFTNQLFPKSGRHIDVTTSDGTLPDATTALLEHYIRKAKLRTKVAPALVRNGDVEGQYNIYVSWSTTKRSVTWRGEEEPPIDEEDDTPNPAAEPVETILHEEIKEGFPLVEVIADCDLLVLPQTADSLEEAVAGGGSVTILRRWSKGTIRKMMKDGFIRKDAGKLLIGQLKAAETEEPGKINKAARMVDAAGIQRPQDAAPHANVYETFSILKVMGKDMLCRAFYGGEQQILGCHRNPMWSDRLPILSVPVEKVQGAFKGQSKVKPCAPIQYAANDAVNEAWDSAAYAMMPIIMTDPEKNPRVGSLILSLGAVWETDPKSTQFAQFPQLWQHGFEMVAACKSEVSQTLSVSPAAITQGTSSSQKYKTPNQAMVAQEQQVDILTTADAVTVLEEGIFTPMLALFVELDHQFRDRDITVKSFGQMGQRANMQDIPPIQMDKRYVFTWFGVEQARGAQMLQQQIAGMNVLRGIPPQQLGGYTLNLVPLITKFTEDTFGPTLAPLIFVSPAEQMPVPVDEENQLLQLGFEVPTHEMDDDVQHIQAHMAMLQMLQLQEGGGKNQKKVQQHIFAHAQQKARKEQMAMQAQQAAVAGPMGGAPGVPGGAGPGVAGTPRIGAQPGPVGPQGPPGMIHQDQLRDPAVMPRKMG